MTVGGYIAGFVSGIGFAVVTFVGAVLYVVARKA